MKTHCPAEEKRRIEMGAIGSHQPVLLDEVVGLLVPAAKKTIVDCTIGMGGHSEALLNATPAQVNLIGIDVDEGNLKLVKQRLLGFGRRVRLLKANFTELEQVLVEVDVAQADVIMADLGVSSNQLDDSTRGLSFSQDGPLDMRLDDRITGTAADLVNRLREKELADLIYDYGQERYSRRIARAIVSRRKKGRIDRTGELARIVAAAYPIRTRKRRRGVHPATRTFQALRIAINDELVSLEKLLETIPKVLATGGRAGVISFHSLEDRRVKHAFADLSRRGWGRLLTKKPITPGADELERNPRSRSAKLRVVERIA